MTRRYPTSVPTKEPVPRTTQLPFPLRRVAVRERNRRSRWSACSDTCDVTSSVVLSLTTNLAEAARSAFPGRLSGGLNTPYKRFSSHLKGLTTCW